MRHGITLTRIIKDGRSKDGSKDDSKRSFLFHVI